MPQLIRNISANVLDNFIGEVIIFKPIVGQVQEGDYINMNGFIAYLQNFSSAISIQTIQKPLLFGLANTYNEPTVTLTISY